MTLLSVVVPVTKLAGNISNLSSWIRDLQTQDVEVIIVHDVQDLHTAKDLKEIIASAPNTVIRYYEITAGNPGAARNFGLEKSLSEWVVFWDADDIPNLENVIGAVSKASSKDEVIIANYSISYFPHQNKVKKLHNSQLLSIALNPGVWRMIFRRESIGAVRFPSLSMGEDQAFLVLYRIFSRRIMFTDFISYEYFSGNIGQLTSSQKALNSLPDAIEIFFKEIEIMSKKERYRYLVMFLRMALTYLRIDSNWKKMEAWIKLNSIIRSYAVIIGTLPKTFLWGAYSKISSIVTRKLFR